MQFLACLGDQLASTAVTCGLYVKMDARKKSPKAKPKHLKRPLGACMGCYQS